MLYEGVNKVEITQVYSRDKTIALPYIDEIFATVTDFVGKHPGCHKSWPFNATENFLATGKSLVLI